jgi:mono/diheme cytochrome c family protein
MRPALLLSLLALAAIVVIVGSRGGDGVLHRSGTDEERTQGNGPRPARAAVSEDAKEPPRVIDREHPGYAIYTRRGCNVCHGPDLGGSNMAPSLLDAQEHWTAETFARYLADPDSSVRANERLKQLDAKYSMFVMPAYPLDEVELVPLTSLILGTQD